MTAASPGSGRFLFMRHGETLLNLQRRRCGGDVDIPLTEAGEAQAQAAAERLRPLASRIDAVIASPLLRTRRTADIVRGALGDCPLILHEGLIERRLGAWNGQGIAETQALFDAGTPPPGGEAEEVFRARIAAALDDILTRGHALPLLVGSKGVGRVVGLLFGSGAEGPMGNAEIREIAVPRPATSTT